MLFRIRPKEFAINSVVREVLTSLVEIVVSKDTEIDMQIDQIAFDQSVTIKRIKSLKVPPELKKKGRHKGSDKTNVIGLNKSKKWERKFPLRFWRAVGERMYFQWKDMPELRSISFFC